MNDEKLEGNFVNSTDYKQNFTNWYSTEPDNNRGDQDYVAMSPDGTWGDFQSSKWFSIICQHDCGDTQLPTSSTTITSNTGVTITAFSETTTLFPKITNLITT